MAVELLNTDTSSGILDLTKGASTNEEEIKNTEIEEAEVVEGAELDEESNTEKSSGDDVPADTDIGDSDETDELGGESYFFGDTKMEVTVPDEINNALTEAGIDSKDLLKQLFKKGGDFSLDEDTRTKLEGKFGKHMVDGYLSMYKGMNEQAAAKGKLDQEAAETTLKQQGEQYSEAVGGAEGIIKMEEYILSNLDENQITAYNSVMENGDHASQMLVISQLRKTMELEDQAKNGDKKLDLVGDKETSSVSGGSVLDKGFITNAEFNALMEKDEYWTDREYMARVDNARMAGKRQGK